MRKAQLVDKIQETFKRMDGWNNFYTGLGQKNKDKRTGLSFAGNTILSRDTLTHMYRSDGLTKKIINTPIHDMTREGFTITHDVDEQMSKQLKKIGFYKALKTSLMWQDLYGGSIILMGIIDGQEMDQPVNENNIKSIDFLKVFDRHQINNSSMDLYNKPSDKKYGSQKYYYINPDITSEPFVVHESRVLRFDGEQLPDQEFISNNYWHDSMIQGVYDRLKGLSGTYADIETIISEFIIGVMKVKNLDNILQMGNGESMMKRLNYLDISKSMLNTILVDTDDESFERISSTVSGIELLIDKLERALCSQINIPMSILFGDSPKGLNSAGSDNEQTRRYYDYVATRQIEKMESQIERIVYLLSLSKDSPNIKDDWEIQFNSLWQPTEKEISETEKLNSETYKNLTEIGVLLPNEIAEHKFSSDSNNLKIEIFDEHKKIIEDDKKNLKEVADLGVFVEKEKDETEEKD